MIFALEESGFSIHDIHARLEEEEILVSKKTLYRLLKKYREHHTYTVGLQIYEGQILRECLPDWLVGWLVG